MNSIVKKVLERAAQELAEELALAQDIQEDVERAAELEKLEEMERKKQKAEENYERLKMEFALSARVHLGLVNEHGLRNQELVALKVKTGLPCYIVCIRVGLSEKDLKLVSFTI